MGQPKQTTPSQGSLTESVLITLPVHPLHGESLLLVREVQRTGGRYYEVEHPGGWRTLVPRSWTDRTVSASPPSSPIGRPSRVSVEGLGVLALAIETALASAAETAAPVPVDKRDKLRDTADPSDPLPQVIDAASPAAATPEPPTLDHAVATNPQRPGLRMGFASPQCPATGRDPTEGGTR